MLAVREYKHSLILEEDATGTIKATENDLRLLLTLTPDDVRVSMVVADTNATYVAFRTEMHTGRRAYALIQNTHCEVFWTVAGNGTALKFVSTITKNGLEHLAAAHVQETLLSLRSVSYTRRTHGRLDLRV